MRLLILGIYEALHFGSDDGESDQAEEQQRPQLKSERCGMWERVVRHDQSLRRHGVWILFDGKNVRAGVTPNVRIPSHFLMFL